MSAPKRDIVDRTFCFSVAIIRFCTDRPWKSVCRPIQTQLLKSGTSMGSNVEECRAGRARRTSSTR